MEFRPAHEDEVGAVVEMMRADSLGQGREFASLDAYRAAFRKIQSDPNADVIVGVRDGKIVATYQFNVLHGLSRGACTRAQIEAVRATAELRGEGIGHALMQDAEARAIASGATLIQLTSDRTRPSAHGFYTQLGYVGSHVGFKKVLS